MMPRRLATTYAMLHHGIPPPPKPSPPTSDSSGYINALDDDDTDTSLSSEEEEEEPPLPCGPLQAALLGSFETVHREYSMRAVHAVLLKQRTRPSLVASPISWWSSPLEAATAAKRAAAASARKETTSQPRVFIDLGTDDPSTSGCAGH
jgi:hypothetical protein